MHIYIILETNQTTSDLAMFTKMDKPNTKELPPLYQHRKLFACLVIFHDFLSSDFQEILSGTQSEYQTMIINP